MSSSIIIGGGLAGLTAALHLAERGLTPLILEARDDHAGGRVRGGDTIILPNGHTFRAEHGVHGIWNHYVNLKSMLRRHDILPDLVPALEENWVYKRGSRQHTAPVGASIRYSWLAAPLHYVQILLRPRILRVLGLDDLASLFNVWYSLVLAVGIDPLAEAQPMQGYMLSDLVKNWSPALRAFIIGLTRNGMAAPPEEVPAAGFIAFIRFYTLMRRDAWQFSYLPGDAGTALIDPLVAKIEALGGKIQLGTRVTNLEPTASGWQITMEGARRKQPEHLTTPHLLLATDAPAAQRLLTSSPSTASQANQMYFPRGMASAVIRLWFNRLPNPTPEAGLFSGDYILDNYFWLHRIHEQARKWSQTTGGSLLEAHIYGPQTLLDEPDPVLLARAIADIHTVYPELRGARIHHTLARNDPTHTLFGVGPRGQHPATRTPWDKLYLAGDWVYHPAPAFYLERATLTGLEAANALLEDIGLPPHPLEPYPEPEPLAKAIETLMRRGRKLRRNQV